MFLPTTRTVCPRATHPGELIDIIYTKNDGREVQKLEKYAAMSLEAMLKEASAEGCKNLAVTTGYRSYAVQKGIYDARYEANKAAHGANAEAETIKAVSYPVQATIRRVSESIFTTLRRRIFRSQRHRSTSGSLLTVPTSDLFSAIPRTRRA